MSEQQIHGGNGLKNSPMPTVMDRVLAFIKREKIVHRVSGSSNHLETGMRFEVDAADGSGYVELNRYDSGLGVLRGDQLLVRQRQIEMKDIHTHFGFTLALEGYIDIEIPQFNQTERVAAGEIAFRSGRVDLVRQTFPVGQRFRSIAMDIPATMLEAWQSETLVNLNKGIGRLLHDTKAPFLRVFQADEAVMALAEKTLEIKTSTVFGRLLYEATALNLLARILDPSTPTIAHMTRSQMRQAYLQQVLDEAIGILQDEWTSPPTIAGLARRVGLNERTLQDEFRHRTGHTIGEYARMQRMERARELIETKGLGVQEAALHVGYSNPSHFSNAFKKYFGHLPSVRRQEQ